MAFSRSQPKGGETIYGTVVWGTKNENLTVPNIRFFDRASGVESYIVPEGERGTAQVDGVIKHVTFKPAESFSDRDANKTRAQEDKVLRDWNMIVYVSSGQGPDAGVIFKMVNEGIPDDRTLGVLNQIKKHLDDGRKDDPVRISLYSKRDGDKLWPRSSIIYSTGVDEEGNLLFEDYKNAVFTDGFPPRREPMLKPGTDEVLKSGDKIVYDYDPAIAWANTTAGEIASHFNNPEKDAEAEQAASEDAPHDDDEAVDPSEGLEQEQEAASNKPRQ